VPMKLFATNRANLLKRLRLNENLPKSTVILVQGGESKMRYCSDHEEAFRQVNIKSYSCRLSLNCGSNLFSKFFFSS
jgi:hypothetical protein